MRDIHCSESWLRVFKDELVLKFVARWFALIGASMFGAAFFGGSFYAMVWEHEWVEKMVQQHFAAIIGLPCAALAAALLVMILEINAGDIVMKGPFGFEFKGAAGPLTFWIFCFLAIAVAIKINW